jgi:ribosome-binding protein aMBF1 (putative translation factor)
MIEIKLRRAHTAEEELLLEQECGLCGVRFDGASVVARVVGADLGSVCPACLEHLHQRNPEAFPSRDDLEEATRLYPEPIWRTVAEVLRLEEENLEAALAAYDAAWLARA